MAKAITRVHILAKELGVKSKVIIDKCQAEGLDVKNHMSTLSAGLAATIREWFSVGEHRTTVENAAPVDEEYLVESGPEADELAELDAKYPPSEDEDEEFAEKPAKPQIETPVKKEVKEPTGPKDRQGRIIEKVKPIPITNYPKPEMVKLPSIADIKPAGPQLNIPAPAKLNGPKVLRVESIDKPRPKRERTRPERPERAERRADARPGARTDTRPPSRHKQGPQVAPISPNDIPLPIKSLDDKKRKKDKKVVDASKSPKKKLRGGRDVEERKAKLAAVRGQKTGFRAPRKLDSKKGRSNQNVVEVVRPDKITLSEPITVRSLSAALAMKVNDIIVKLMQQGVMVTANQGISVEAAEMVALDLGVEMEVEALKSLEDKISEEFESRERNEVKRPAIVTMLGHVDHGKTSLLDRIRSASVADGEAGGITQHTSAYQAEINGRKVTFLDTPGHAAFTEMRARGANMTDIVVLVIAADDGVMPQTVEAIRHAQAAEVTIVVALNKIDLQGVDVNKIYGQLSEYDLVPTEWGGNTDVIKTSAHTGEGIDDLVEHLDLLADINEYKADPNVPASGWVVEAKMTSTQGVVATLLLKEGTLSKGDVLLAGIGYGRLRSMKNSYGKSLKKATPSMPVEVTGLSEVPSAGDRFYVVEDINKAQKAAEEKKSIEREQTLSKRSQVTLENLFSQIEAGKVKEIKIVVRADVQGSVDVLQKHLTDLSTEEVKVRIIHSGVGGITEGDVVLAEASDAIVIGFNVVPEDQVKQLADGKGVDIRLYNIIYRITEDLKDAMSGMLDPDEVEESLGKLLVRDIFKVPGVGTIAGCYVIEGLIKRNCKVRLIRNNIIIKDNGNLESLKHFKDDVKEVKTGFECGLKIAGYDDIKIDDNIEAYHIKEVKRKID